MTSGKTTLVKVESGAVDKPSVQTMTKITKAFRRFC